MLQSICLCMIVKNEEETILRALESALPFIDALAVVIDADTDDETPEIISKFVIDHDLPAYIEKKKWTDYATQRNISLDLGRESGCEYLLVLDGDDYFEGNIEVPPGNREQRRSKNWKEYYDKDLLYVDVQYKELKYSRPHILRASKPFHYDLPVHEALVCHDPFTDGKIFGLTLKIGGKEKTEEETKEKFLHDAGVLVKYLTQNPEHRRCMFYAAQSYRDGGELETACSFYRLRISFGGWEEEVYVSLLEFAKCWERLEKPVFDVYLAYMNAFHFRPQRGEAQAHLKRYLKEKQYPIAEWNTMEPESPPKGDVLFVEPRCYRSFYK